MAMEMNIHGYCRKHGHSVSGPKSWVWNPMLRGIVPHQKDGVKPLVSPDEGSKPNACLSQRTRSRVPTGVQRTHLFSSLISCASCGRSLHRCVTGYHRSDGSVVMPQTGGGRLIKESLVRTQAVEALRTGSHLMAREAQRANNAKARQKPLKVEAENKFAALLQLQESGELPGLDTAISSLRDQIAALSAPVVGPDWEGLVAELVAGGLDSASDEELRVIFFEFFERISSEGESEGRQVQASAARRAAMRKMAVNRSIKPPGTIAWRGSTRQVFFRTVESGWWPFEQVKRAHSLADVLSAPLHSGMLQPQASGLRSERAEEFAITTAA